MVYYLLCHDIEAFQGQYTFKYKLDTLWRWSTFDECINAFHSDMIETFSQYGENWGNIDVLDIDYISTHGFSFVTDGTTIMIKYDNDDHISPKVDSLQYGTSGGLQLGFIGLIISSETYIRYSLDEIERTDYEADFEIEIVWRSTPRLDPLPGLLEPPLMAPIRTASRFHPIS